MEAPIREQLIRWRKAQKLTIEQAAARIGITLSTYWRWEKGKQPSPMAMEKIKQQLSKP